MFRSVDSNYPFLKYQQNQFLTFRWCCSLQMHTISCFDYDALRFILDSSGCDKIYQNHNNNKYNRKLLINVGQDWAVNNKQMQCRATQCVAFDVFISRVTLILPHRHQQSLIHRQKRKRTAKFSLSNFH